MKCMDCDGTGVGISKHFPKCQTCNGTGKLCDVCGEAAIDSGADICEDCASDREEE